jgi:hypothetical protein
VKQIVEAQGGRVGVQSAPRGEGSVFFAVLPIDTRKSRLSDELEAAEREAASLTAAR